MKVVLLVLVGVLVLAGCTPAPPQTNQDTSGSEQNPPLQSGSSDTAQPSVAENELDSNTDSSGQTDATAGQYRDYDPSAVTQAATSGDAVLFFHAKWCPTCKAADADITQNADQIPAGLTIFKTDYDTQTELKKKYGVTYQHTFVHVDAAGNLINKWNGGELQEIVENI